MAVSESGRKGVSRVGVGIQIGLIRVESVKIVIKLTLVAPGCQVPFTVHLLRKSSQTLFVVLPGPAGFAHVAVET